jgi:hypothetical protein
MWRRVLGIGASQLLPCKVGNSGKFGQRSRCDSCLVTISADHDAAQYQVG